MRNLGDFKAGDVLYGKFTTYRPSTGEPFSLSGGSGPALRVYKNNSTTESTSGVTLTTDFDGIPGLNHFTIDTSADGTFYSEGSSFDIVIASGTVDNVSVAGACVAGFTLKRTALAAAQAVWDEVLAGHATAGTAGKALTDSAAGSLDAAGVRAAVGLASANLDTQLGAIDAKTTNLPSDPADQSLVLAATTAIYDRIGAPAGLTLAADVAAVKSDTAAIKAKTDSLNFTVAGIVDSNVQYVNDVQIQGNGQPGTEWGPV